jgi:putative ABC transport system permease protein
MSVAVEERTVEIEAGGGGGPARRALVRWAWRLFRREWRQQMLVLSLLTLAVAATTWGVAAATNTIKPPQTTFTLPGSDSQLSGDVAAFQATFGPVQAIAHQEVPVPGSVATVDLRAQDPDNTYPQKTLRLLSGQYPTGPNEVAMTHDVADLFGLRVGDTWQQDGRDLRLVGVVENPADLHDQFALVPPGRVDPADKVTILVNATRQQIESFRPPSRAPLSIASESSGARAAAAAAVLALATIMLLFVGLVAVAGFTVMAQRRLRAMGMLGAIGATDRHVRLVMLANGAVVGAVAAVVGTALGLACWIVSAPWLETASAHRIERFDLPWLAIGGAMLLAVVTAVAAAWWPARAASHIPVVAALSGRPPRPQPAHRFAALGGVLLLVGLGLIALAHQTRPMLVVAGTVATTLGVLFLAPLAIRGLAATARRAPIAVRLAVRDLARYQARSGAALGAVTLAIGIAAAIAISATASAAGSADQSGGNLPPNELIVYVAGGGAGRPLPDLTAAQLQTLQTTIDDIATSLGTHDVVPLVAAINPNGPEVPGFGGNQGGHETAALVKVTEEPGGRTNVEFINQVYVATPAVLAHYGIATTDIDPNTDLVTSRTDLDGLQLGFGPRETITPKIQTLELPTYTSSPNTLVTEHAVQAHGMQDAPAGWLMETPGALTPAQINAARQLAAGGGLSIETRYAQQSLTELRNGATAVGMLVALGVLAMTVGLIRSETANDLRTLAATGASSNTRRTLTGATAGALALLGALLGTAGAYLAVVAWNRSDLHNLKHVPYLNLVVIVVGLPLVATTAGWLLAGRQPPAIARQPLE